jgi:hypothetical protein
LTDFTENLRDLQHSLQRCEDKLASHDALGGASKDPKLLERVKVWNKYELKQHHVVLWQLACLS